MIPRFQTLRALAQMSSYATKMHEHWQQEPSSVHQDWNEFFKTNQNVSTNMSRPADEKTKQLIISTYFLIRYFRMRGHELANLDPLNLKNYEQFGKIYVKNPLEKDLVENKVFNEADLDTPFHFPQDKIFIDEISGFLAEKSEWTLREVQNRLKQIYSGSVGLESMHLTSYEQKKWLMRAFEKLSVHKTSKENKLKILEELAKVESFNSFLNDKLKTSKRFGVEGLCSMVVGLNQLVETAVDNGINYIGFGMAHRGRLNALANVFDKPLQKIFAEFQENLDTEQHQAWGNSGDVKYHLGVTVEKNVKDKEVRLSILPNPSHLETVNPVCMGHVKAVQDCNGNNKESLAVLIHGDAAVAGQGVVYECLQMAYLNHYHNHGVVHIVANNQIGFTTTPAEARTGLYCTDVAKSIQAPVIHVNADDPEMVSEVMKMATEYRQKFYKDIFVDIIGYRRYGHNEQDQPAFTQPMMYQEIGKRPNIYQLYRDKLLAEGVISDSQVKELWSQKLSKINQAYVESQKETFDIKKWRVPSYYKVVDFTNLGEINRTGLDMDTLKSIGESITKLPETFTPHSSIKKIYDARVNAIKTGEGIDFALAQALAFGSLLKEGFNVRLSGQDVERGTFSHRHASIVDQKNEDKYTPIRSLIAPQDHNRVQIENSFLSEYAALGFEYGYSLTNPNTLTIWQAQFGDFANGAQIIIDNYLCSGESKWNVQNGLVVNLPHGMDGQGPEHSSARMERYLQLVSESWVSIAEERADKGYDAMKATNMHVICCSNAANLFHAYRRQLRRDYRKPLINFVSKKLLKLRDAGSPLSQLTKDSFETVIGEKDESIDPKNVKKVVVTSGQAFYSILEKRKQLNRKDVAIVRIEQLAPFDYDKFKKQVKSYVNATQFVWFQEEHRNSGAWGYLAPRLDFILAEMKKQAKLNYSDIQCISRRNSASPAVGKKRKHDEEQKEILNCLFAK